MSKIMVRRFREEDAEQYVALKNFVWRSAYANIFPEEVFLEKENNFEKDVENIKKENNDKNKFIYVAVADEKVIGFVYGTTKSEYEHYENLGYADLMAMYVHPDFQGKGIASKFKELFENWARKNGAKKFVIGVLKDNIKARHIYEKWGGKKDSYSQGFIKLGVSYDEVFYLFDL